MFCMYAYKNAIFLKQKSGSLSSSVLQVWIILGTLSFFYATRSENPVGRKQTSANRSLLNAY